MPVGSAAAGESVLPLPLLHFPPRSKDRVHSNAGSGGELLFASTLVLPLQKEQARGPAHASCIQNGCICGGVRGLELLSGALLELTAVWSSVPLSQPPPKSLGGLSGYKN